MLRRRPATNSALVLPSGNGGGPRTFRCRQAVDGEGHEIDQEHAVVAKAVEPGRLA